MLEGLTEEKDDKLSMVECSPVTITGFYQILDPMELFKYYA